MFVPFAEMIGIDKDFHKSMICIFTFRRELYRKMGLLQGLLSGYCNDFCFVTNIPVKRNVAMAGRNYFKRKGIADRRYVREKVLALA